MNHRDDIRRIARDEHGSIAIFMTIMLIATGMIAAMLVQVEFGMRTSRRAGDSANALQVADAGVNEAVQNAPTIACPPTPPCSFTHSATVGSGSYTYTATQDQTLNNVWHVDAVGTDATGVKRHVKADAYGQAQFSSPMYVQNLLTVGAGALLDSYYSGLSNTTGCSRKGIISMADGSKVSFTSGGKGNANCTGRVIDTTWTYSMDGCNVYSTNPNVVLPPTGQANCPPAPYTQRINQDYPIQALTMPTKPAGTTVVWSPADGSLGTTFSCSPTNPLQAGAIYKYQTVTLLDGCYINWGTLTPSQYYSNPVTVWANDIEFGATSGHATNSVINAPSASTCPVSTGGWGYVDIQNNPNSWYCTGWAQTLKIYVPGNSTTVNYNGTGTAVWAIINGPGATVNLNAPQLQMFGALVAANVNVKSQFSWHFDETLQSVTTGKYTLQNWREEGS
jgi:Tfp pilus assembly protein PilX